MQKEVSSLEATKTITRIISPNREQKSAALPSKIVAVEKTDKDKIRIVACGNFAKPSENEVLYSPTADAVSLRVVLCLAELFQWDITAINVSTAFLNAELNADNGVNAPVYIKPPTVLISVNLAVFGEVWQINRALYGLRESPRAWGLHRDNCMRTWKLSQNRVLVQCSVDECVWRIEEAGNNRLVGILLVYVDDILIVSSPEISKEIQEKSMRLGSAAEFKICH